MRCHRFIFLTLLPYFGSDAIAQERLEGGELRQPITGLELGGERVIILVDVSDSMFDKTAAGVERGAGMSPEQRRQGSKWRQATDIVASLTAELDPNSQFQIIAYSDEARSLVTDADGGWLPAANRALVDEAMRSLRTEVPLRGGSNLRAAFVAADALQPPADTLYLITDGLPSVSSSNSEEGGHRRRGKEGLDLPNRVIPTDAPVNVILLPMEGESVAVPAYWMLALRTGGSLLAPAEDAGTDGILGVALDGQHLVFVVDTSGSMLKFAWNDVRNHLVETINAYPSLEGIQILNDEGKFLLREFENGWIPASPPEVTAVLDALAVWRDFSDSDPREGVMAAIDFVSEHEGGDTAIYVYSDDLPKGNRRAWAEFVTSVSEKNRADGAAKKARIHAVAFPVYFEVTGQLLTAANFAELMRELTQRNGGSFIALPTGWSPSSEAAR